MYPEFYTVVGEDLPRYDIEFKDKNGNPTTIDDFGISHRQ